MKTPTWYKVKEHLVNYSIIFGDTVAEKKWAWFLDTREALQRSGVLADVGQLMWETIKKYDPEIIYGRGFGAAQILAATQIAAEKDGHQISTLLARDERKPRNRQRIVEGPRHREKNLRAVYIDDATNFGNAYRKTIAALKEDNIKVKTVACACLFDFWNWQGTRRVELLGMPVERLFYRHDLGMTRIDPKDKPVVGDILWRNLAHNQWHKWIKSPPVIHEDLVYWANDKHEVFAQKLKTGEIIWQWQGPFVTQEKGIAAEPQVYKDKLYISSYDGILYCFDRFTGTLIYNHKLDMFLHSTPTFSDEKQELYIATEGGIQNKRGDIVSLDIMSGQLKWRVPTEHVIPASPYIFKNQIICGSNDGYLYSVTDGVLNWKTNTGTVKGRVNSINSTIIVSTEKGRLLGLDENGNILWVRTTGTQTRHQFVAVHETYKLAYIINEDGYALAYDELGNQKWLRRLRGVCAWGLRLRGDELLIISETGYTVILDAATGEKKQMTMLKTPVNCPGDFNDEYVVVHTLKQGLFTYKRATE